MTTLSQSELIAAACATKNLDPALVVDVRLTDSDIFLQTEALGEIRVERSALPANILAAMRQTAAEAVRDIPANTLATMRQAGAEADHTPPALYIRDVPSNTLAAIVAAGYTTLAAISQAGDDELLAVDGVGRAMLKRIRSAIIDAATAVDVDEHP